MVKPSEITRQNPWWIHGDRFIRYDKDLASAQEGPIFFERKRFELTKNGIFTLIGCRQVGKTVYLKETVRKLIENGVNPRHILYLSADTFTSRTRRELRNAIDDFLDRNRDAVTLYIFLDEVTSIKDWNLELKHLADRGITRKACVVVTGSSAVGLRRKGELLPGRGLEGNQYLIKPLTFRNFVFHTIKHLEKKAGLEVEFCDTLVKLEDVLSKLSINLDLTMDEMLRKVNDLQYFKDALEYLLRIYLMIGGFPNVINRYFSSEGKIDNKLAETFIRYVLGDMTSRNRHETIARQILKAIIDKYTNRYSFSKIAEDVETSLPTTIDYLEYLEQSFIILVLNSYDFNKKTLKFKGAKKVYFLDPFVLHSIKTYLSGDVLQKLIDESLGDEELLSQLVEGTVCCHLAINKEIPYLRDMKTFLWFYYDKRGREIDCVIKQNRGYLGIETKYQRSISLKEIRRVPQIKNYIVLSKDEFEKKEEVLIVPVEIFLALLELSDRNI